MTAVDISAAELARAVKVRPPSVSDWLSGKTKTIKGENLLRAAAALRCSPQWLAEGLGPESLDDAGKPAQGGGASVSQLTDPLTEEATKILKLLDPPSRGEALQWLRGFAAGRKIVPYWTDGQDHLLAKRR